MLIPGTDVVLGIGEVQQFAALVIGSHSDRRVRWSAVHGSIDTLGRYRAPGRALVDTVSARSIVDTLRAATVPIRIAHQIIFWRARSSSGEESEDIYIAFLVDSSLLRIDRLTFDPGQDLYPVWNRQGTRFAFNSHSGHRPRHGLSTLARDGTDETPLRAACDYDSVYRADWSPTGAQLVFGCWTGGIGLINSDGTGFRMLPGQPWDTHPSWHPDGTKLVFGNIETSQIYVMNIDGTNRVALTNDPSVIYHSPVWSPDGTRIAVVRKPANWTPYVGDIQVWVMNADGTGMYQVTNDSIGANSPAWSDDGRRILYTGGCCLSETMDIWVVNTDGTGPVNLTRSPWTAESYANWRPPGQTRELLRAATAPN